MRQWRLSSPELLRFRHPRSLSSAALGSLSSFPSQTELVQRQIQLERKALDTAVRAAGELHEVMKDTRIIAERILQGKLETQWKRALSESLALEQARCLNHTPGTDRSIYGAYIVLLEPEVLAHITIREALAASLGPENGTPTVRLAMTVGSAVEQALAGALADSSQRGLTSAISRALERDRHEGGGGSTSFSGGGKRGGPGKGEKRARSKGDGQPSTSGRMSGGDSYRNTPTDVVLAQTSEVDWPNVVRLKVGAVLLELLRRCALIHVDPSTHKLLEEEGIYVSSSRLGDLGDVGGGGISSSSGDSGGGIDSTVSTASGSSGSGSGSDTDSSFNPIEFPPVKEPAIPLFRTKGEDDGEWVIGSPLSKGNPLGRVTSEPRLKTRQQRVVEKQEQVAESDTMSVLHRARLLGRALTQPMVSPAGEVQNTSARLPGGSRGSTLNLLQRGSENGDEELVLGGEGAWLGMRGTVLLDKKLNSPTRAPAGKQSLPHEGKGDGGATFKGVELSELGTEVDRLEFNSMINQGVVFAQARGDAKLEKEAAKLSREAFSRSVDISSTDIEDIEVYGTVSTATNSGIARKSGIGGTQGDTQNESRSKSINASETPEAAPPFSSSTFSSKSSSPQPSHVLQTSSASYVDRIALSLSARVASLTPHREVLLPDGRTVWAVPAFLHHYIFTRITSEGQHRSLKGDSPVDGLVFKADEVGNIGEGTIGVVGLEEGAMEMSNAVEGVKGVSQSRVLGKTTKTDGHSRGSAQVGYASDWNPTHHEQDARKARFVGLIFVHPRLTEILSVRAALLSQVVPAPMVVPPSPWVSFWGPAPYLTSRFPLMRTLPTHRQIVERALRDSIQQTVSDSSEAVSSLRGFIPGPQGDITSHSAGIESAPSGENQFGSFAKVIEALNYLGSLPWVINASILSTVRDLWNDAGDPEGRGGRAPAPGSPTIPNVPPFESQDPPIPNTLSLSSPSVSPRDLSRLRLARANAHSLRSDFRLKLEVAKEHLHDPAIYFPHNMDFRGRVYPLPPHLNHMGSDLPRGLLLFQRAVPLGPSGLRWLQIHLANLMGRDKMSFEDRVAWVETKTDEIMSSSTNPLKCGGSSSGTPWWAEGDAPWQTLSVAQELATIYSLPAHARPLYATRVPVHQDGSCNGLQHYAALGKDIAGAAAVNLISPSNPAKEGPADVYTRVLNLVLQRIEEDLQLPVEPSHASARLGAHPPPINMFAQAQASGLHSDPAIMSATAPLRKMCAIFLSGRVDRKVVKQTVMTTVYGVTFMGARVQIWNRLKERCTLENTPSGMAFDVDDVDHLLQASSQYLARVTLNSLGTLFNNADAIKDWLTEVAKSVAARDQPLSWITPLGIPCTQPYRDSTRRNVMTVLQTMVVNDASDSSLPVSRSRQKSAFPPNFIHSLDSSHMFLTALACKREGIDFAAVHDSFWTHPGHVGVMRNHLRAQFVDLYSRPILEDFRDSLLDRIPGLQLPAIPPKGDLDLREVLKSPYFFS